MEFRFVLADHQICNYGLIPFMIIFETELADYIIWSAIRLNVIHSRLILHSVQIFVQ
jgi:hypothetical protein